MYMYMYIKGGIMPHRVPRLFILVFLFLNLIVASPALFGRDNLGSNSLWGLDFEDIIGAGAAGIEALSELWDFSMAPEESTTPSGVPLEQPDQSRLQSPDPVAFPLFEPTGIKTCTAAGEGQGDQFDKLEIEKSWWQVEQEPDTGQPVISACDLPKDHNNDAYILYEIRFEEGRQKARWPSAILVSDPANNDRFRYNVIRVGTSTIYTYQKIPNAIFMRQGKVVKLGYVRRRGWLVGAAGQPKEVALKWFEDEILATTQTLDSDITRVAIAHFSAVWIAKAFAKADRSGSPYWIADG